MKNRLFTSTAVGALMVMSSVAQADDFVLRGFGGLNFAGDEPLDRFTTKDPDTSTSGSLLTKAHTHHHSGDFDFDSDTGYVLGAAIGYQVSSNILLEIEAAYRRNGLDIEGIGTKFHFDNYYSTGGAISSTKLTGSDTAIFSIRKRAGRSRDTPASVSGPPVAWRPERSAR